MTIHITFLLGGRPMAKWFTLVRFKHKNKHLQVTWKENCDN